MNLNFSKKQTYTLVGFFLFVVLLFTGLYFLLLAPIENEIGIKQEELTSAEQLIDLIQAKVGNESVNTFETTMELQKKLPVKPLAEQLLLDFERAEVISHSFIMNMVFGEGAEELTAETPSNPEANTVAPSNPEANTETSSNSESNTETEEDASKKEMDEAKVDVIPPGIKRMTVTLTVQTPSFDELKTFIKSLESTKRIIAVEKLDFSGTEEIYSIEQSLEPLTYTVTVSAFYSPDLMDLQNQLPHMDTPRPSNKDNPFANAPNLLEETASE